MTACGDGRRRRAARASGAGWPPLSEDAEKAASNGDEQRADKKIGGDGEGHAGFAHAAKIQDGDDDQNADAEGDRVRQQRRNRGDQRADAGGNADRGGEDVVGEQRGGGEQAGAARRD